MTSPTILRQITQRFDDSQNALVLQSSDFSLQGLKDMVEKEVIDLAPKYQRRERWDIARQSTLIESFLLNIPVPPIYLSEEEYGIYSIIDGKQRITAVYAYLSNSFPLKKLSSFTEINGLRFRDLPDTLKNALRVRPFLRAITLLKQSNPELKYEVFQRLNRGGIKLNNQEIRNVAFRGRLNDAIYDAAENPFLKRSLNIHSNKSKAYQQMQDAELVLRFLTLREDWKDFSGNFSRSMDNFMQRNVDISDEDALELIQAFELSIRRVEKLWDKHAFQRWDGGQWRRQALAGLYDAQMIACDQITENEYRELSKSPHLVLAVTQSLFHDKTFEEAVRLGTNTPARMTYRVEKTLQKLRTLI